MRVRLEILDPTEWALLAKDAHAIVFEKVRDPAMDRLTGALLAIDEEKNQPVGYATYRELDNESVYLQWGGAFPEIRGSIHVARIYRLFLFTLEAYRRIGTHIENTNVSYLRLAMAHGFRIIGTRTFRGEVLVELLREKP